MRLIRKTLAAGALAGAIVGVAAVPAFANDCYNASRSLQGNTQAAAHSPNWWSIPEFVTAMGCVSSDQELAALMSVVNADPAIPAGFTMYFNPTSPHVLASGAPLANVVNGTGIDHSDDTGVLNALITDLATAVPDSPCLG